MTYGTKMNNFEYSNSFNHVHQLKLINQNHLINNVQIDGFVLIRNAICFSNKSLEIQNQIKIKWFYQNEDF